MSLNKYEKIQRKDLTLDKPTMEVTNCGFKASA